MTLTYQEAKQQLAALTKQTEEIRQAELPGVLAEIQTIIEGFKLSETDIFPQARFKKKRGEPAKLYRDPASGKIWRGRGKTPQWLKDLAVDGRKIDEYAFFNPAAK